MNTTPQPRLQRPSSTITAAALAGMACTAAFLVAGEFGYTVSAQTASAVTTFVSALVGYFKPERVLTQRAQAQVAAGQKPVL